MKLAADWPRYLIARPLKDGSSSFYWQPAGRDRHKGCPVIAEPLGTNFEAAADRARLLNTQLDAWREGKAVPAALKGLERFGTVDWWIDTYLRHEACTRLATNTQDDYREALYRLADVPTRVTHPVTGERGRVGDLHVGTLSQAAVDKIYEKLRRGGKITCRAERAIDVARRAWKIVRRAHPGLFLIPVVGEDGKQRRLPTNPFQDVLRSKYERGTAIPATRDQVLALAKSADNTGHPAIGVAALICYEWLQRPADVRGGTLTWSDYRPESQPDKVKIFHHKTGERVWMPLEVELADENGELVRRQLFPELEAMIAKLPRFAVSMIAMRPARGPRDAAGNTIARPYSESHAQHIVQRARAKAGLPAHITLEACRHGGMTELGDAELPEQLVMSLSGHLTPAAARLYVKRTERQRLTAAVQRRDFVDLALRQSQKRKL